jgi:hypothetical protein
VQGMKHPRLTFSVDVEAREQRGGPEERIAGKECLPIDESGRQMEHPEVVERKDPARGQREEKWRGEKKRGEPERQAHGVMLARPRRFLARHPVRTSAYRSGGAIARARVGSSAQARGQRVETGRATVCFSGGLHDGTQELLNGVGRELPARAAEAAIAAVRRPREPQKEMRYAGLTQPARQTFRMDGRHDLIAVAMDQQGWRRALVDERQWRRNIIGFAGRLW